MLIWYLMKNICMYELISVLGSFETKRSLINEASKHFSICFSSPLQIGEAMWRLKEPFC